MAIVSIHAPAKGASKETNNKLRWEAYVPEDDTTFLLYIPKWRVPEPWPARIFVKVMPVSELSPSASDAQAKGEPTMDAPIRVVLYRVAMHTKTVRYAPSEEPNKREIGEPYIPYSLLPSPKADEVALEVTWDLKSQGQF